MKERLQIFNSKNNNNNNNNNSNVPYRSVTKRIIPNTNVPNSNAPNTNIPNSNVPLKSESNINKEEPKKLVINPNLYGKDGNIRIMASKDKVNIRQSRRDNMNIKIKDNNKNENDLQEYLYGNKEEKSDKNKKETPKQRAVTSERVILNPKERVVLKPRERAIPKPRPKASFKQREIETPVGKENESFKKETSKRENEILKDKENPREKYLKRKIVAPKETPKETPKEFLKEKYIKRKIETPKLNLKPTPKQTIKETPKQTPREIPKQTSKEIPKQTSKEAPKEIPKIAPKEIPKEAPKEIPKEIPKPKEASKEIPKQTPKEAPMEAPKEITKEVPKEAPKEIPRENVKEAPKEIPKEIPKETPKEIPKGIPKEKEKQKVNQKEKDNPKEKEAPKEKEKEKGKRPSIQKKSITENPIKRSEKSDNPKKEINTNNFLTNNDKKKTEQKDPNLQNVIEALKNPKSQYEQEQESKENKQPAKPGIQVKKITFGERIRNLVKCLSPSPKNPPPAKPKNNPSKEIEKPEENKNIEEKPKEKIEEKNKAVIDKKETYKNRNVSADTRKIKIKNKMKDNFENAQNPLNDINKNKEYYKKEYVNIEPMKYSAFLKKVKLSRTKIERETFCEGFFIASFPYTKAEVIENSQSFPSPCGHKQCSTFPAMKPEIIMRYPLTDSKNLELNNLAATICFPTGIKVCYSEEEPTSMIDDYLTTITNQKGERYYMMTYHFYQKVNNNEYTKNYEMHPLKNHLQKFGDSYLTLSDEGFTEKIIKKVQETLELCQELGFRDYVYVPFCLSLISKYPYGYEMTRSLQSLLNVMSEEQIIEFSKTDFKINDLIMYLINSVPVPIEKNTRVKFYIPFFEKGIYLKCPKLDEINIVNINYIRLFELFNIENFLLIIRLLLFEKKILFIDDDYTRLSEVTDAFTSLLYPFKWVHTYIPIMSDQMLKYLETFLPFLNGIHSSLMPLVSQLFNNSEIEDGDEIFLIYNKEGKIDISSSLKKKKKKVANYIKSNVPPLPVSIEKKLRAKLTEIKDTYNSKMKMPLRRVSRATEPVDISNFDKNIRDAFIDIFVDMFKDYPKYICLLDNDVVFNKNLFMKSVDKNDKRFYDELIDTQLFQQFTQTIFTSECDYFNKLISEVEEKDELKEFSGIPLDVKNEKVYVIPPIYLGTEETSNANIQRYVSQYYPTNLESNFIAKDEYKDIFGVIKPSHRVIPTVTEIAEEDYDNDNCLVYMLPNQNRVSMRKSLLRESSEQLFKTISNNSTSNDLQNLAFKKTLTSANFNDELKERQKDEIKELIKDYLKKIFKSEKIDTKDTKIKTEILNILKKPFGRESFISLLSNNNKNIVTLQINSFKFLAFLIYNVLVESLQMAETDNLLEEVYLLIKSTMYFQIEYKGKSKTLFNAMKEKIRDFPKVNQKNFWNVWFEKELEIKRDRGDANKQIIILNICSKMVELEISKIIIKDFVDGLIKNAFGENSEMGNQTSKMFMRKITEAKYTLNTKDKK